MGVGLGKASSIARVCIVSVLGLAGAFAMSQSAKAAYSLYGFGGPSGVFSVACAGPGDQSLASTNGFDNRTFFKTGSSCTSNAVTGAANESFTSGNVSAAASGTSALGLLNGQVSMSTDAQNAVIFPAGFVDLGFIDTLAINSAPHNGQVATVTAQVNLSGTLTAAGPNVFSRLELIVGTNNFSAFNLVSTKQTQAGVNPSPLVVNETVTFDLNFIVGTPDQFLVRAQAQSMTSSATSLGNNQADVNFVGTVQWGGIQSVTVGGQQISNYTAVGTTSGIDWNEPAAVPLPPTMLLLGGAVASISLLLRRTA